MKTVLRFVAVYATHDIRSSFQISDINYLITLKNDVQWKYFLISFLFVVISKSSINFIL